MTVRMRHAGVEGEITVTEEAVPFHAASGWEVIEDKPEDTSGKEQTAGEPDGEKSTSERPRASAAKKKES
jgi:hypothetical protein